jgi:CubicO group peptidase (beta-lactamase class C family)/peptidoglycan/LPS O-acetylase OafA/YrhL
MTMTETTPQTTPASAPRIGGEQRDRALDLLRALATLRVFLWHATGAAVLTFVGALPVMFWLNGMLLMRSVQRSSVSRVLADRARRLLIPYWAFGAVMVPLMALRSNGEYDVTRSLLGWVVPVVDPVGATWQQGWITEPLWYLRAYVWLLLISPLLIWIVRQAPLRTLATLASITVTLEVFLGTSFWSVQDAATYGFFFAAGLTTTLLGEPGRTVRRVTGMLAAGGAVALWQVHAPLDGVVNNSHTLHLLVGLATLAAALEARGALSRLANLRLVSSVVDRMRERSLTFYLWHAPIVGVAWIAADRIGLANRAATGTIAVTGGLAVSFAVSGVLCGLENLTAGRRIRAARRHEFAIVAAGMLAVTVGLAAPVTGAAHLPPTPSQAPDQAAFSTTEEAAFLLAPGAVEATPVQSAKTGLEPRPGSPIDRTEQVAAPTKTTTIAPSTAVPGRRGVTPAVGSWQTLAPQLDVEKAAAIDAAVARWLATKPTQTVELALLAPGRFRHTSGYTANGEPIVNDGTIPLHSITKTFTAALLLRAVEDGRIRIEDPIGTLDVAPWFTVAQNVTVGQLLSHRSGLVTYTDTRMFKTDWRSIDGWEPALRAAQDEGLAFTPGTKQLYSSTNFIVAGLLAAQIYRLPIEELIERDLIDPLGLNRTTVGRPEPGAPGTGTGNMRAHITDVARWANAMWRDKNVLGPVGNQLALYVDPVNLLGYGNFAFCPCRKDGKRTVPAAYGGNGAEATMRYYSTVDTVVVLRTPSGSPAGVDELIAEILRIANR